MDKNKKIRGFQGYKIFSSFIRNSYRPLYNLNAWGVCSCPEA
jgi:hypothetical protein